MLNLKRLEIVSGLQSPNWRPKKRREGRWSCNPKPKIHLQAFIWVEMLFSLGFSLLKSPAGVHLCSPFVGCTLRTLYCPPLASPPSALCTRTGYPKYVGKKEEKETKRSGCIAWFGVFSSCKASGWRHNKLRASPRWGQVWT